MNPTEASALIVKTAIEDKVIAFDDNNYPNTPAKEAQNEFNAKQIRDFYERVFKATNQKANKYILLSKEDYIYGFISSVKTSRRRRCFVYGITGKSTACMTVK